MSLSQDSRRNHPWEYPNCPSCGIEIYVDRHHHADFVCHKCGVFSDE